MSNYFIMRVWAFWRRVIYGSGFFAFFGALFTGIFLLYIYEPSSCFDNSENGSESGIDCGGRCVRICTVDTLPPLERWVRTFRSSEGRYNVVAYVENRNVTAGVKELSFTMSLYDKDGLITERKGVTPFAPQSLVPFFEGRVDTGRRVPTQVMISYDSNPVWVPATSNDIRFTTERRILASADTQPVLSATLENASLTDARDVEVVATIFDKKGNALTASRTRVPSFEARSTEDIVFTWQEPIATTIRSCEVPTDVILGIDLSGSMNNDAGTPPQPITSVLTAAQSFVSRLNEDDQIGVVTFATEASTKIPLTADQKNVGSAISKLGIAPTDETGSTNTGDALNRAREEFGSTRHSVDARKIFILLTDGLATAPDDEPEAYALLAAEALKATGVVVYTIGIGADVDEEFLKQIATDGKHYFRAPERTTIGRIYEDITSALCEDGAAVIEIIPKPPAVYTPLQ